jgi:hypothetical protein
MLLNLSHKTTFVYDGEARDSINDIRLCPISDALQHCRSFKLTINPYTSLLDYVDFNANIVHSFNIIEGHQELVIDAESEVETLRNEERKAISVVSCDELVNFPDKTILSEFLSYSTYIPSSELLTKESKNLIGKTRSDVWSEAKKIGTYIFNTFKYSPGATEVKTLATDVLELKAGVCQDFAHVMIGLCRLHGIPARYVSGYFLNTTRRHEEIEASHAWVEVYIPSYGWAGFDPTHDREADERYIKIAVGKDYADIIPVRGTYRGGRTLTLKVEVKVRELIHV